MINYPVPPQTAHAAAGASFCFGFLLAGFLLTGIGLKKSQVHVTIVQHVKPQQAKEIQNGCIDE